jgi:hypothetical protein
VANEFQVIVFRQAKLDGQCIYDWLSERSPQGAEAWARAYIEALESLTKYLLRCGLAPENEDHDVEIRQRVFRTSHGNPYRLLFTVAGNQVRVLHVRGPGQLFVG